MHILVEIINYYQSCEIEIGSSHSPNINSIENVLRIIKKKLNQYKLKNVDKLKSYLKSIYDDSQKNEIQR